MKKITAIICSLIFSIVLHAQKAEWNEMNAFHEVMGKTFHPSENGNLKPLKDSASILLIKAKKWQNAKVPQGYNVNVVEPILKQLVAKCTQIKSAVLAKKEDEKLTKLIAEAHEIFHELIEKCSKEESHN